MNKENDEDYTCLEIPNVNPNKIECEDMNKRFIKKSLLDKLSKLSNGFIEKYINFINQQIELERNNIIQNYKSRSS